MAGFGGDERTVADGERRAGAHCQQVHAAVVQQGQVDLQHVQADELWVKLVGRRLWLAMALAVPSRLWLGGVVSGRRDRAMLSQLVGFVRACALSLAIVVCVDGLAGYPAAFRNGFRTKEESGKPGRPKLLPEPGLQIGQVIKQYRQRRVVSSTTRVVQGTKEQIEAVLAQSGGGQQINTAFIERLNATWRCRRSCLVRRGRAVARQDSSLMSSLYLVGCLYNFCSAHASLRERAPLGGKRKWKERTPAMAAGLTDHCWSVSELLHWRIPPPPWEARKRAGRKPKVPRVWRWALRPRRVVYI